MSSRLVDAIDTDRLVADLTALIRTDSVTGTAAESVIQHELAEVVGGLGMDVDLWEIDVPATRADPESPGDETDRVTAHGLVATTGPGMPGLILAGHVDVVPVGDPAAWTVDPFGGERRADLVYGRGACDMKAGVAVNLAIARAIATTGVSLAEPLALHMVVSEEDGGLGAFATLRRGHTGRAAVITEPTSGSMVVACAGALTFRLEVPGLAAHGSNRLAGASAVTAFEGIHQALRALEDRRNSGLDPEVTALFGGNPQPYPLSIGIVRAGDWASTVPDLLVAEGRYGVRLGEDLAGARAEFEDAVAQAAAGNPWLRDHPVTVTWPGGQFAPGQLPPGDPIASDLTAAVASVGGRVPARTAAPYGSDLRHYLGAGIPTVLYGPGELDQAHAPDEYVSVRQCVEVARALAVLVERRCGVRG